LGRFGLAIAAACSSTFAISAAAQTVDDDLTALDARITRLEDLNQIEIVQRTYGYFVDRAQWTLLADLFTEDATLEIGGKGVFVGRHRVLEYMQTAFGPDGPDYGMLAQHMQFQTIPDVSPDGETGWLRGRAFVMSVGGWGLPLYENEFEKGEDGVWRISRLSGPFTMYTNWQGWGVNALNNTWPDKFEPAPDYPPTTVYLTYPAYWVAPFHYPNPVTGEVFTPGSQPAGAYHRPPGTAEQTAVEAMGRLVDGSQPIAGPGGE